MFDDTLFVGAIIVSQSLASNKYIIAGGSGFLGLSLAHYLLERGATVTILSRSKPKVSGPLDACGVGWPDPRLLDE